MLVDGVRDWPTTDSVIGTSGDAILYAFPQGGNRARLYIGYSIEDKTRLAGADKAKTISRGVPRGHDPRLRAFR